MLDEHGRLVSGNARSNPKPRIKVTAQTGKKTEEGKNAVSGKKPAADDPGGNKGT